MCNIPAFLHCLVLYLEADIKEESHRTNNKTHSFLWVFRVYFFKIFAECTTYVHTVYNIPVGNWGDFK